MTSGGILMLAIMGAAYAFSKAQSEKKKRVEGGHIYTGPVEDIERDDRPPAGQLVAQGTVETSTWGTVAYRIAVSADRDHYVAMVRAPEMVEYETIKDDKDQPVLFDSETSATAYAEAWILSGDEETMLAFPSADADEPEPPPADGLAADCTAGYYTGTKHTLSPSLDSYLGPAAKAKLMTDGAPREWYLTHWGQQQIYVAARSQLQGTNRSVIGVVVSDILHTLLPDCAWAGDPESFGVLTINKPKHTLAEYRIRRDAWALANAAAAQIGFKLGGDSPAKHLLTVPDTNGAVIGRGYLDLPEIPAATVLPIGRRVEILVGDYKLFQLPRPPFKYAERLYARVIDTDVNTGNPKLVILEEFQGKDVAPKFADKHGFAAGKVIELHKTEPTGIRKVFPEGVT